MENQWEKLKNNNNTIKITTSKKKTNNKIQNLICVLAGGIQNNGEPNTFVKKRLDKAIELFNTIPENTIILVLGGGTYHKPPYINDSKFVVHESTNCSIYLNNNGIKPEFIFREWGSYDTIANGFFAFTNYINYINLLNIFVITSDFHITRSKTIFNYFNTLFNKNYEILYIETESNLDSETYQIRTKREKESNKNFIDNIVNKITDPEDFINWFYTQHKAYASIINYIENNEINKSY